MIQLTAAKVVLLLFLVTLTGLTHAKDNHAFNQISLKVKASLQVDNDQLVAILRVQENGKDPAQLAGMVNKKMKKMIDKLSPYPQIEYQTIDYSSDPIYRDGVIKSWNVSQQLQLRSLNFEQLRQFIAKVSKLSTIQSISFSVSDKTVERVKQQLTKQAIDKFQAKATMVTTQFGKQDYHLVHVNIGNQDVHRPQLMQRFHVEPMHTIQSSQPALAAGTNKLSVEVSGTIELF